HEQCERKGEACKLHRLGFVVTKEGEFIRLTSKY
ncbi:MAG: hypothetical protein ACI8TQ_003792, partial [Planctomycetota bacterium]